MPAAPNKSSVPFVGTVTDSLELMKKVWDLSGLASVPTTLSPSSLSQFAQTLPQALPTLMTPTLDLNELDKRIADLRAVEQWLALNANVLRTTIQGLEVQRNTIAALKGLGGSLFAATSKATDAAKAAASSTPPARKRAEEDKAASASEGATPLASAAAWWGALQEQFAKVTAAALAGQTRTATPTQPTPPTPKTSKTSTPSAASKRRAPRKRSKASPSST